MIQISICFHQKYRFQCNIETCIFSKSTLLLFDSDISGNVSAIALSINPCILTSSDFTTQTLDPWSNQYMFKGLIRDLFSKREIHSDLVVPLLILGFSPGICNGRVELLLFLSVKSHWKLRLMHLYVTTVLPSRHVKISHSRKLVNILLFLYLCHTWNHSIQIMISSLSCFEHFSSSSFTNHSSDIFLVHRESDRYFSAIMGCI